MNVQNALSSGARLTAKHDDTPHVGDNWNITMMLATRIKRPCLKKDKHFSTSRENEMKNQAEEVSMIREKVTEQSR